MPQLNQLPTAAERREVIRKSAKPSLLILDPVGVSGHHKFVTAVNVLGGWYDPAVVRMVRNKIHKKGGRFDVKAELEKARDAKAERDRQEREEQERRKFFVLTTRYHTRPVDVFDRRQETTVTDTGAAKSDITESQETLLLRFGYRKSEVHKMSKREASARIDDCLHRQKHGLWSMRQERCLNKYGYKSPMTYDAASSLIRRLEANGWRPIEYRPAGSGSDE